MSVLEILNSGALLFVVAMQLRTEGRISSLEAKVELLLKQKV
jgi:hypothetical protein